MGAFANFAAAEARVKAKTSGFGDGTWVEAHACYATGTATPAVRVQRFMSPTNPAYGAWVEITDDATV